MVVRSGLLMGLCGIVAGFPSSPVPLRGSLLRIGPAQRRVSTVPLGLSMNAEKLEKIVVCTGPTCTKNGGGKKLKKIVDEMAAPFGIEVESVNCVSECAECGLGPNIETTEKGASGPFAGKVINGVRTAADVARILGIEAKAS